MWVYTLIATILGATGTGLSIYNTWHARRQPVRDLQFERRKFLKKYCDALYQHTLAAEQGAKEGRWPNQMQRDQLSAAGPGLEAVANELVIPSKDQIDVIRQRVLTAEQAISANIVPEDDSAFDGVPEAVQTSLAELNRTLEYALEGLRTIEQGRTIRYKRQFKELEAAYSNSSQ
jgi:hypothetical protein